jgi:hypothetical protein
MAAGMPRQAKETSNSARGAAVMEAGMCLATERNERFRERRGGDGSEHIVGKQKKRESERRGGHRGGHIVGKRKNRAIPEAALW